MDGANPFAKFAPTKPAYVPPPEKSENPFVQFTKSVDTSPFSKDELLEAYRQLPRDDPRREQVKQQIIKLGNVPFERGILSKDQAQIAGITEGASLGLSDEINAGIAGITGGRISALGGETYDEELQLQREQAANAQHDDPGGFADGQVAGAIIQAAPTLGASLGTTMATRGLINVGGSALQNGIYEAASSEGDMSDRLAAGGEGALWGATFGLAPTVVEGAWKGGKALVKGGIKQTQKITNPRAFVEKEAVDTIAADWKARAKLEAKAASQGKQPTERRFLDAQDVVDAEGAGQRTMVSDLGGDGLRRKLKAVDNASSEASELMRGNAALRQTDQGQRVTEVISDSFGDTLNPKTVRDELMERARTENGAAYAAAESHPNASHLWSPELQGAISSNVGKQALKKAIESSRDEAIRNGHEIIEPIFEEGADGLMQFTGRFRRPTGEMVDGIQGVGLGLRFWDHVKRGFDEVIEGLPVTAKTEAARIRAIKNSMVASLDKSVPQYAKARGTAREFFGMEDAHEAGADYFKNMPAYNTAEARQALQAMKPATRELFARGYAAELVNRITQMGDAENVNKLFKSQQSRMKMRDALGDQAADNLEAYTHREMVQGLLGKHLGENSTTIQQQIAMEGLKVTAATGAGTYATGDITTGLMAGLAMRGGYKFGQRMIIQRYAKAMAELVTSEDPVVIARILSKVSKQTGYMNFSRAVGNGAASIGGAAGRAGPTINIPGGGLPGGAQRPDPRLPFADGGRVPFAGGGLVKKAVEAFGDEFDTLFAAGKKSAAPKIEFPNAGRQTVDMPVRNQHPGVYGNPREIVADVRVAEEDPALKRLFGVTRDDLFEMSKRKGNVDDVLGIKDAVTRPSQATQGVKTKANQQRLLDALDEASKREDLWKGMHGWYVMDPAYQRLVELHGPEEGARLYRRLNTFTGIASSGSSVPTELNRGTAALVMDNLGRLDEFGRFGGVGKELAGKGYPAELAAVKGHAYHSTSQYPAMERFAQTGEHGMKSAKVPTYIATSTPPELGNFTDLPVADGHFTRAIGLPDTRLGESDPSAAMTMGEYKSVAPWFRDSVANEAGLESAQAQPVLWGAFSQHTGVDTPVGAPKLELLAQSIMETARRLKISPELARDLVLAGKEHAYAEGGLVSALGAAA
jgi:hypothetical protein